MLTREGALSPKHGDAQRAARWNPLPPSSSLLSSSTTTTGDGDETSTTTTSLLVSQLSFDSPDEQLLSYLTLLSDDGDAAGVSHSIAQIHASFLQRAAAATHTVEANDRPLVAGGGDGAVSYSYTPESFQLCEGCQPRRIGDSVYYKLRCGKFPNQVLGARVYTGDQFKFKAHSAPRPPHVHLQQVLVHFPPRSSTQHEEAVLLAGTLPQPQSSPPSRPMGGSSESVDSLLFVSLKNNSTTTITELLERGHCVSVERDLPQATLEDFIQCRRRRRRRANKQQQQQQSPDTALYAKRLCVLLLQVVTGLQQQQLCINSPVMSIELRPSSVFLVWPQSRAPSRDVIEDKEQDSNNTVKEADAVQVNWERLGAPRVVLDTSPPPSSGTLSLSSGTTSNTQLGRLIQRGLDPPEGEKGLTSVPRCSFLKSTRDPYTETLRGLAAWLLRDDEGISTEQQLSDTKAILQAILWGPPQLFNTGPQSHVAATAGSPGTLDAWLTIRRALLVLKMAERGLLLPPLGDGASAAAPDWEERLCLQYFASCDGEA
ncbi:hypothetical protein CRUP_038654, partial [Coryphaenoides rupestris]